MAKARKTTPSAGPQRDDGAVRSVLLAAWDRFEAGDMVEARSLAQAVLAGRVGPDELEGATRLARKLGGNQTLPVDESIESVAKVMIERTRPVGRSYLFAAVSMGVFTLLVALAASRYHAS